jgi:hypothetical protein
LPRNYCVDAKLRAGFHGPLIPVTFGESLHQPHLGLEPGYVVNSRDMNAHFFGRCFNDDTLRHASTTIRQCDGFAHCQSRHGCCMTSFFPEELSTAARF